MDLSSGAKRLLPYWGAIQNAVTLRATTQDLWQAVRDVATREGVDLSGVGAIDMGQLRSIAASMRNALENFASLGLGDAITRASIGTDLAARSPSEMAATPSWFVRFEQDTIQDGQLVTQWRTSVMDGFLPPTKGALLQAVEQDALAMADDYGTTHVGIGQIQISAV